MELTLVIALLVAVAIAAGFALRSAALQAQLARARGQLAELRAELAGASERIERLLAEKAAAEHRAVRLQAEGEAQAQRFEAQQRALEEMKTSFRAISAEALSHNHEAFLRMAEARFENLLLLNKKHSEKQHDALGHLLGPIHELLQKHQRALQDLEKARLTQHSSLSAQVKQVSAVHEQLNAQTSRLVAALKRPEQRGRWGEMQLQRLVEVAGLTEHCDFETQVAVASDDGVLRPDMVVQLPGDRQVVIDAKVPLDAYLDLLDPDADHAARSKAHVRQLREHVRALSRKQYFRQFERAPDYVVMFVPVESALSAALADDPDLHAEALASGVLLSSPTLLLALLHTVAYGWRQQALADNARAIAKVGAELHERIGVFVEHFAKLGGQLERATSSYNQAVGSLENRLVASAQRLEALAAASPRRAASPEPIDLRPRRLALAEQDAG